MKRPFVASVSLLSCLSLAGCVSERASAPEVQTTTEAPIHAHSVARPVAPAKSASLIPKETIIHSTAPMHPGFRAVVSRLQDLGYLPIVDASIHGRGPARYHPFFLWPVPAPLQKAANAQPWNAENPFIRGAVIQFERANGILKGTGRSEGHLHASVIHALFENAAIHDPYPWQWVYVTKGKGSHQPEQLHIWQSGAPKGQWIWRTLVNTGVLGATPNGTWPIYQRLPSTTMRGVFPVPVSWSTYHALSGQQVPQWGGSPLMQSARGMVGGHPVQWQPYNDPGIKWVSYFDNGRGIHYYPRASYGFPQSAGCVEEPKATAPITYRLLHYGVPVTIAPAVFPFTSASLHKDSPHAR